MKSIYLPCLLAIFLSNFAVSQQSYLGADLRIDFPLSFENTSNLVFIGYSFEYGISPFGRLPLYFTVSYADMKGGGNNYDDYFQEEKDFYTETNILYRNRAKLFNVNGKYFFGHEFSSFRPFLSAGIGVSSLRVDETVRDLEDNRGNLAKFQHHSKTALGYQFGMGAEFTLTKLFSRFAGLLPGMKFSFTYSFRNTFKRVNYADASNINNMYGPDNSTYQNINGAKHINVTNHNVYSKKYARLDNKYFGLKGLSIGIVQTF